MKAGLYLGKLIFAGLVLLSALPAAGAERNVLPDPESIRARIIESAGGEQRIGRLSSLRVIGAMEGVSGFPGRYQLLLAASDRRLETWDIGYIRQTTGFNGADGWQQVEGVREIAGDELTRLRRASGFRRFYSLLLERASFRVETGSCQSRPTYVLHFDQDESAAAYQVDRESFRLLCQGWRDPYEEGMTDIVYEFGDYRSVRGIPLPYLIREVRPNGSISVSVQRYDINPRLAPGVFDNPVRSHFSEPYQLSLRTLPMRVFKEADGAWSTGSLRSWGMYYYGSESWSFDLVVDELYGRYVSPVSAELQLYSGANLVSTERFEADALNRMRRYPVMRFRPQRHIYGFRHNLSAPTALGVDRIVYTYVGRTRDGATQTASLEFPVSTYRPRTSLIFPIRGMAVVMTGHEFYELEHKYERSQQFGIDIMPLGDDFGLARNGGNQSEDYVGFGTREILAPAAGTVVYARNDVPDGRVRAEFLRMRDGLTAIAGNVVIIDHGTGEFSVFCHMRQGSVRVRTGDHVAQGQQIGVLGASGSPGLPHLHYQLQAGPDLFGADGLPLVFENLSAAGWLNRGGRIESPRRGVFVIAR